MHGSPNFVKIMNEGRLVGYGGTYKCEEKDVIATIPVGYADGYWRSLGNNIGMVYSKYLDTKCPVVGRVSMDAITIKFPSSILSIDKPDKFDIQLITPDYDKDTSAQGIANKLRTISYEVGTRLSCRIPRIYTKNQTLNEIVAKVDAIEKSIY